MKLALTLLLYIMCSLLALSIRLAKRHKNALGKSIVRVFHAGIVTILGNSLTIIAQDVHFASVGFCIYYCSIDWLLVAMLDYTEKYTENIESTKLSRGIVYSLCIIDNICILSHIVTGYLFEVMKYPLANGRAFYLAGNHSSYFQVHLTLCYIWVGGIILSFIWKMAKTPRFYWKKYLIILLAFVFVITTNGVYLMLNLVVDISVFFYSLLALALCFFSLYFVPQGLLEKTLAHVVAGMDDAVFCFDLWGHCVYVNKQATEFLKADEKNAKQLAEEMFAATEKKYGSSERESERWIQKWEKDGAVVHYENVYQKLFDKKKRCIGSFISMTDRTKEVESYTRDHINATRDKMTGIYNREYFYKKVEKRLKDNPNRKYKLVVSNIRGFKLFNDLFGEAKGNEVLLMEAELLKKYSREDSIYGRLQGDMFAILVNAGAEEQLFIDCINQMKERFSSKQYAMHIHMVVYEIKDSSEPIALMCDKAKMTMDSFQGDFNTVAIYYTEELLEKSMKDTQLVSELDRAISEKQFQMYLQPQITADGEMIGAEALVRWPHPEWGMVFPNDFIPAFERTGVIYQLDRYIWEQAAAQLAKWKEKGRGDLYISVNISTKDFYYVDLYEEFTSLVKKYEINPRRLKLEITETVLMTEMKTQINLLDRLRAYGFEVEIDDFGSGYSSLNMLKDIQVDTLKIDMGFLSKSINAQKGHAILKSVINMAKLLDMDIITEGVEEKGQVESLAEMGCALFQGYYFSKPIPVVDFEEKYQI